MCVESYLFAVVDPYQVMEVLDTATDEEIRKQYRKFAKKYHPDISKLPDAEQKFLEVQKAYNMIKDETARQNTRAKEEFGDTFEGVDMDKIPEDSRSSIMKVLEHIQERRSVLNGLLPSAVVYEILGLRTIDREKLFTARSVRRKFPHYIAVAADEFVYSSPVQLVFHLFDRGVDQDLLGTIKYDLRENSMTWHSPDDRLIATATLSNHSKDSLLTTEDTFMVKSEGRVVGTFSSKHWRGLSLVSLLSIHLPEKYLPPLEGSHFCFFGSRSAWHAKDQEAKEVAANVVRELVGCCCIAS